MIELSTDLFERVQFSVSSRNAEAKVAHCAVHVFASKSVDNLHNIQWQYVASGVPCLLRNRELHKSGRKYVWSMSLCLYDARYGVLVWKARLSPNSDYTAVADKFHVFALSEVDVIVGLLFSTKEQACEMSTTFTTWNQDNLRDDGKKGHTPSVPVNQPSRFKKEMISKPCNFQHIQGTQALDECLEIEKTKADIIAALFGLGTKAGRSEPDNAVTSKRKDKKAKKDLAKPKMSFKEITIPCTSLTSPTPTSPLSPVNTEFPQFPQIPPVGIQAPPYLTPPDGANGYTDSPVSHLAQGYTADPVTQPHPSLGYTDNLVIEPHPFLAETQPYPEVGYPQQQDPMGSNHANHVVTYPGDSHPDDSDHLQPLQPETFFNASQGSFGYNSSPPRLDLNLEKEFSESILFKSPLAIT